MIDGDEAQLIERTRGTTTFVAIDPTRRFATVAGAGEPLAATGPPPSESGSRCAAEVVGVCQRALDMTLAYVKERKQFGVPVGVLPGSRTSLRRDAAATPRAPARPPTTRRGPPTPIRSCCLKQRLVAGAAAAEAARRSPLGAIQVHGGIGFTWEADVHWLYKRAQLDASLLGGTKPHRAALTRLAAARARQLT